MAYLRLAVLSLLVVVVVVLASALSPFTNLKNKFDNRNQVARQLHAFVDIYRDYQRENLKKSIDKKYFKFNQTAKNILNELKTALSLGFNYNHPSDTIFNNVLPDLKKIDQLLDQSFVLNYNFHDITSPDQLRKKVDNFLNSITKKDLKKMIPYIVQDRIGRKIRKRGYFYQGLQNYFKSTLLLCDNFETIQDILFYCYLRLTAAEIKAFILVAEYYFLDTDKNNGVNLRRYLISMMFTSLAHFESYKKLIYTAMRDFEPQCKCQSRFPEVIKIDSSTRLTRFNPWFASGAQFYTNRTRNICIHLGSGSTPEKIIFDICIEGDPTQAVLRKNGKIMQKHPIQSSDKSISTNSIQLAEYTLLVLNIYNNFKIHANKDTVIFDRVNITNELQSITHWTISFPELNDKTSAWFILMGDIPKLVSGFSPLIEGLKICRCYPWSGTFNMYQWKMIHTSKILESNRTDVCRNIPDNMDDYAKHLNNGIPSKDFFLGRSKFSVDHINFEKFDVVSGCIPS